MICSLLRILVFLTFPAVFVIQAPAQTVDKIITKYVKAIGGREKLMKIKTLRLTGTYQEGKDSFNTSILWKRPSLRLVIVGDWGDAYLEGYNGTSWEYSQPTKQLKLTAGTPPEAVARRGAEFDESLVDYKSKGYRVEYIGREKILGQDSFHLQVTLDDGWKKDYYINAKTYLITALRKAMPLHAKGDDIVSLTAYDDYRPVAGVLYPHAFIEKKLATGETMNQLQWTKIEANVAIDDRKFIAPGGKN